LAKGKDTGVIDLLFVGQLDKGYLATLVDKVEKLIKKKVKYLIYNTQEFELVAQKEGLVEKSLLIWNKE